MSANHPAVLNTIDMVARGASDGWIIIVCFRAGRRGGPSTYPFHVTQLEEAKRFAKANAADHNVYVEASLQAQPPAAGERGSGLGASHTAVGSVDFDTLAGKHKETRLPSGRECLTKLLEAAKVPAPGIVLDTGGGFLGLWPLAEPITIASEPDREHAKRVLRGLQGRLRFVASETFGWKLDTTDDLPRLLRVPGTLNHKYDPPRSVEVVS